jgi:STE24 endopeptidase
MAKAVIMGRRYSVLYQAQRWAASLLKTRRSEAERLRLGSSECPGRNPQALGFALPGFTGSRVRHGLASHMLVMVLCCAGVCAAGPNHGLLPEKAGHSKTQRIQAARSHLGVHQVSPPKITPAMRQYSHTYYALDFIEPLYVLLILWLIMATKASAYLRSLAETISRRRFFTLFFYYLFLSIVLFVLEFPFSYFAGFYLPHAFGQSHESIFLWLGDLVKGRLIEIVVYTVVLWILYSLIRRTPLFWALKFWIALIPLIALSIFAEPLVIDPLFNRFTPMSDTLPLSIKIHELATKAGIPNAKILIADMSRRTEETNAYVTGIGSSARIVLWDTTLRRMPPDQVLAVVGHEMGHYVLKHLYWGFLFTVGLLLIVLPISQKAYNWSVAKYGERWRVGEAEDFATIPVLLFILTLFSFILSPITNGYSRFIEHQADAYGLNITGNAPAMARAFVSLSEQNLSEPDPPPFIEFWLFSHPSLQHRIQFVMGKK